MSVADLAVWNLNSQIKNSQLGAVIIRAGLKIKKNGEKRFRDIHSSFCSNASEAELVLEGVEGLLAYYYHVIFLLFLPFFSWIKPPTLLCCSAHQICDSCQIWSTLQYGATWSCYLHLSLVSCKISSQ